MARSKRPPPNPSPNTSSMSVDYDSEISLLKQTVSTLTRQMTEMSKEFTKLTTQLAEQITVNQQLTKDIAQLRSTSPLASATAQSIGGAGPRNQVQSTLLPYGAPPCSSFFKTFTSDWSATNSEISYLAMSCDILRNAVHVAAKDKVAVVERLYDDRGAADSSSEQALCNAVCDAANISKPIKVWRHTGRNSENGRNRDRPLKVEFASSADRNTFIRNFRRHLPKDTSAKFPGRVPMCRRDMTPHELQLLYRLREECHNRNQAAGCNAFYVRDLTLCETTRHR